MSFEVYLTSTTSACTQHGHDFIPSKLRVALFATAQFPTVRDLKIRRSSCIGRLLMPEAVSSIRSKYLDLNTTKRGKKTTNIQPNISRDGKMSKAVSPFPSALLKYQTNTTEWEQTQPNGNKHNQMETNITKWNGIQHKYNHMYWETGDARGGLSQSGPLI